MTFVLALPSFKNIAAGLVGLCLATMCFFAAAPQARAAGLTEPQISAILNLLSAFEVDQQTIVNVEGILRKSPVSGDETSTTPSEKGGVYFSAIPDSGQAPLTVEFVTSVSGTDGDYYVDFGDKGIGWMEKGLTHTYGAGTYFAGLYKCTLHVSEKDCDQSEFIASKTITVGSTESAALSATPTSGMAPLTVSFRGSGSALDPGAYISFGDSANNGWGVTINHTYSYPGTYIAELHKNGAKGEVVATKTISVYSSSEKGDSSAPSATIDQSSLRVDTGGKSAAITAITGSAAGVNQVNVGMKGRDPVYASAIGGRWTATFASVYPGEYLVQVLNNDSGSHYGEVLVMGTLIVTDAVSVGAPGTLMVRAGESDSLGQNTDILPVCVLNADKASVRAGEPVVLSWGSDHATKSGNGLGGFEEADGSKVVRVDTTTIFTKTVYGPGGKATCSAEVDVVGSAASDPTEEMTAAPTPMLAALYSAYTSSINDTSDLMASAVMAPWHAAVESLSQILFAARVY